ncbi:MAG: toprim domain-containing protein [Candidatus Hodarchaeota archaeon]
MLRPNLNEFVDYCNKLTSNSVFIVEGKRDTKILRLLGIKGQIIERGGLSLHELVDKTSQAETIVILTDFDTEGKKLQKIIKNEIQNRKGHGRIDSHARQLLFRFCRAFRVSEIEDLKQFIPLNR